MDTRADEEVVARTYCPALLHATDWNAFDDTYLSVVKNRLLETNDCPSLDTTIVLLPSPLIATHRKSPTSRTGSSSIKTSLMILHVFPKSSDTNTLPSPFTVSRETTTCLTPLADMATEENACNVFVNELVHVSPWSVDW